MNLEIYAPFLASLFRTYDNEIFLSLSRALSLNGEFGGLKWILTCWNLNTYKIKNKLYQAYFYNFWKLKSQDFVISSQLRMKENI